MKSPINSLYAELEKRVFEFSKTTKTLNELKTAHGKLIDENLVMEKENIAFKEAVFVMCDGCVEKGSSNCETCGLHKVGMELWR